jgi:hypothetical protein
VTLDALDRVYSRALLRTRGPAAHLMVTALALVVLPTVAGLAPVAPLLVLALALGADGSVMVTLATIWGGFPAIAAMAGLPAAAALAVAGVELVRLRSRGIAWIALGLAVPLTLVAATAQVILTPCTGSITASIAVPMAIWSTLRAASAMSDLVVDTGFTASAADRDASERELAIKPRSR